MTAALAQAKKALVAGEFPVGCVLVHDGDIVSTGYRLNSGVAGNEMDHAEILALRHLLKADKEIDFSKVVVYSTMEPCLMCFSTLILSGIRTIVYAYEDVMGGGSNLELKNLSPLYAGLDIKVTSGICRNKSIEMFKVFFGGEENQYLNNSILASYTLDQ